MVEPIAIVVTINIAIDGVGIDVVGTAGAAVAVERGGVILGGGPEQLILLMRVTSEAASEAAVVAAVTAWQMSSISC